MVNLITNVIGGSNPTTRVEYSCNSQIKNNLKYVLFKSEKFTVFKLVFYDRDNGTKEFKKINIMFVFILNKLEEKPFFHQINLIKNKIYMSFIHINLVFNLYLKVKKGYGKVFKSKNIYE